jgi:hypothetical protein
MQGKKSGRSTREQFLIIKELTWGLNVDVGVYCCCCQLSMTTFKLLQAYEFFISIIQEVFFFQFKILMNHVTLSTLALQFHNNPEVFLIPKEITSS